MKIHIYANACNGRKEADNVAVGSIQYGHHGYCQLLLPEYTDGSCCTHSFGR